MTASTTMLQRILTGIRTPEQLHSLQELRAGSVAAPSAGGIYGVYFRKRPPGVPDGSHTHRGIELLYIGAVPSTERSKRTLRHRIADHHGDDASRSTFRRSLGSVLGYRRDPGRSRFSFGPKETDLSALICSTTMVCWVECATPWAFEADVIGQFRPHLNLNHNRDGAFARTLINLRRAAGLGGSNRE